MSALGNYGCNHIVGMEMAWDLSSALHCPATIAHPSLLHGYTPAAVAELLGPCALNQTCKMILHVYIVLKKEREKIVYLNQIFSHISNTWSCTVG